MNAKKMYNALRALDRVTNLRVDELTIKVLHGYKSRTRQIEQLTPQQLKLAIALSDTSYQMLNTAVELGKHAYVRASNFTEFACALTPIEHKDPIDNALSILHR